METLGFDTTLCLLSFLDIKAVFTVLRSNKALYQFWSETGLWRLLLCREQSPVLSLNTEPAFSIKRCRSFRTSLWTNLPLEAPFPFLQTTLKHYHQACIIPLKGIAESSHDFDQDIRRTLSVDVGLFWSSIGSASTDSNEYLRYSLQYPAFVFWVGVRLFRAGYQGGVLYPPVQFQLKIGMQDGAWSYISNPITAQVTESLQHLIVLPALILGSYFELVLLGKQQTQETDNLYYVAIEQVRCVGLPADLYGSEHQLTVRNPTLIGDINLEITNSNYQMWEKKLVNHPEIVQREHLESIQELGFLGDYFEAVRTSMRRFTKCESYFFLEHATAEQGQANLVGLTLSEDLGDLLVEKGHVRVALAVFARLQVIKKLVKCLLILERYSECVTLSRSGHFGAPTMEEIKAMARTVGRGDDFEAFLANPTAPLEST